jgi:hypothetical protein
VFHVHISVCFSMSNKDRRFLKIEYNLIVLFSNLFLCIKGKKVVPLCSIEVHLGERRYSTYSFLTSALEGGEWSASRPGRTLPAGKESLVPIV